MDHYLAEPEEHRKADPFQWWRQHEGQFPTIALLAKKYMAIPASSAPSERVFSLAKNILTRRRYRLDPQRLERLVFLNHNRRLLGELRAEHGLPAF